MQHAVFLFTQIFFVVLAVTVVSMVIFTAIKRRDKNDVENNEVNFHNSNDFSDK